MILFVEASTFWKIFSNKNIWNKIFARGIEKLSRTKKFACFEITCAFPLTQYGAFSFLGALFLSPQCSKLTMTNINFKLKNIIIRQYFGRFNIKTLHFCLMYIVASHLAWEFARVYWFEPCILIKIFCHFSSPYSWMYSSKALFAAFFRRTM